MTFSLVWEGRIKRGCRRQHDREEVKYGMMGVPAGDRHQMDQGVRPKEAGAGDRRRPLSGPPCPRGERETGDKEGRADVLDEMGVVGTGLRYPWNSLVPGRTGEQHCQSVATGDDRQNCHYHTPHENLLRAKTRQAVPV
jgi:hypothetical protein